MTPKLHAAAHATLATFRWTVLPRLVLAADFIAVVAISIIVLWLVVVMPVTALAQTPQSPVPAASATDAPQVIHASTVDLDRDGDHDRAVLVRNPKTQDDDLYIYLKAGGLTPSPTRDFARAATPDEDATERRATRAIKDKTASDPTPVRPDLVFAGIADGRVFDFERHGTSLVIMTGCGGCDHGTDTTLTIVHRRGQYLVGGYAITWQTPDSRRHCEIDYLTGKGTIARGPCKAGALKKQRLKGRFAPVRLAEWQKDSPPKACAI